MARTVIGIARTKVPMWVLACVLAAPALPAEEESRADAADNPPPSLTPQPDNEAAQPEEAPESAELESVTVNGIRGSLKSAADKKKDSKQIVDSIVAEDVGKLPDNNVPEALSRVTGVQLDRVHGEGTNITIRGLTDIQTTINGNSSAVGESRFTNLADIPAELLKSVEVYKTRTADQVEGGIAGTVNVELRRPLDLKKGLTVAGSIRDVYSDIGKDWSPYTSLLVANRFDTTLGEMGFLVNTSYSRNNYEEDFIESESPSVFCCSSLSGLPADQQGVITQYAANYGVEEGRIARPSLNLAGQWRANEQLDFVLEGSYFGSDEDRARDRLHLTIRDGTSTVSNVVLAPDGRTVQSLTLTNPKGVAGGPESYYEQVDSNNYTTNLETHWQGDRAQIRASTQYNWSDTRYFNILQTLRLRNQTTAIFNANSSNVPGGGPYIEFPGVDLADVNSYGVFQFHDEQALAKSHELASQADLTFRLSDSNLLRSLQSGLRYSDRYTQRDYGYRDANPVDASGLPPLLSEFPGGSNYLTTTPDIRGVAYAPTWYHIASRGLLANYDAVREYLSGFSSDWDTERPRNNRGQSFTANEHTLAGYGQINYALTTRFPIDGVLGVRVANTWGSSQSATYTPSSTGGPEIVQSATAKGRYTDVLPSLSGIVHFTQQLQLRLAYTLNVERPTFFDMRPYAYYNITANPPRVDAGNPDLRANRETSYDASLEYFFGRAGSASLAAFLKKPDGFLYYSAQMEYVPELGVDALVSQRRNAGPGKFQGFELSAQSFFDFLPGFWSNFGASANATYVPVFRIKFPFDEETAKIPGVYDADNTSKYTYNMAVYYDTPVFSTRVAYNYRAKRKNFIWTEMPEYSPYTMATKRLDAALNYTPYKFVTLSLEATNLLRSYTRGYFGLSDYLPVGTRVAARTVQLGARVRF